MTTRKIQKPAKKAAKKTTAKTAKPAAKRAAKTTTRKAGPRLRIGFARSTICNAIAEELAASIPSKEGAYEKDGVTKTGRAVVDGLFDLRFPPMYGDVSEVFCAGDLVQAAADAMRIADLLMVLSAR